MILADTSVWIDHLRHGDPDLARHLDAGEVACHPLVVAELALGTLRARDEILGLLDGLPALPLATVAEVRAMIEARRLMSRGIGYVDAGLVASCLLTPGTTLWSRDRRLAAVADQLGIAAAV
ncbi:Ribonuclease VapC32 [Roseivivax jejudonensis]|uniref:Ribonuclease VapC n=1 Tax=Roseivivax jejudonensis TaxID=1529041 RepID=A0A1X6ZW07_9RHOB|nr:PIN domain-containing protein [Roseivivax jejudonensis]SLN62987.1 Ribonuclease VapC32 [Roseivivax jejudonensis]